jgi:hypothetical protein
MTYEMSGYILNMRSRTYLVDLVAGQQVQVLVHGPSAVDVSVCRVGSSTSVPVDPLEPMLGTMTSNEILKVVGGRDALSLGSTKEVLLDRIGVVAKRHLDGSLETMNVTIVAGSLVGFVLLHEGDELFGGPALGLEVIVVGSRSAGVHLGVIRHNTCH